MSFTDGYNIDEIDAPKFVSRGEWNLTGTRSCPAYTPLKPVEGLTSGTFGVTGIYEVKNWCLPYDDISGMSGCIGVTLRKMFAISETGTYYNENILLRKTAVLHEGYLPLSYQSGTLDGTVVTMRYGDRIAPHPSGFRTWQPLHYSNPQTVAASVTGRMLSGDFGGDLTTTGYFLTTGDLSTVNVLNTGQQQCILGWFADIASNLTGIKHRVKIIPNTQYGVRP